MPVSRDEFYHVAEEGYQFRRNLHAQWTGEVRPPKKGEWFLSGAIIEAYRAPNDLTVTYPIARLVETRTDTVIRVVGEVGS